MNSFHDKVNEKEATTASALVSPMDPGISPMKASCQDTPLSWHDWRLDERARVQLEFVRGLIALRRAYPVLRRERFLTGRGDALWLHPDGRAMRDDDWGGCVALGLLLR